MKELIREYHGTDPELVLKSQDVDDSIDRDIAEFSTRGYTPAKKAAFELAITTFDGMSSDNYLLGQQEEKTQTKNTVRRACEKKINLVLTAVENVYGQDSAQYNLFTEDKSLSQLTDPQLLRYMEDFADSTEEHLAELNDEGVTAVTVTELRALRTQFNDALKAQRKAEKDRNTGNSNRIKAGNALYKLLVKYCNTGKDIWFGVDESKYNDYVINESSSGNSNLFTGTVAGNTIVNVLNSSNSNYVIGKTLRLKNTTSGPAIGGLYFYGATGAGDGWSGLGVSLNPGQETTFLLDAANFRPFFNIQNQGPNDQTYEVEIL